MCPSEEDMVEVEEAPAPDDSALRSVATLASELKTVSDEIAALEYQLKEKQDRHRMISENELPTAILSTGLRAVPLADGTMIEVVTAYSGSISAANRDAAHGWLRENGLGDYIKRSVAISFGQGESEMATEAVSLLAEKFPGNKLDDKEAVHPATLKAFVKREMEAGNPNAVPEDLFGIYTRRFAEITKTTTKQLKRGARSSEF